MGLVKAGTLYFALVFAMGWVLGPIRELLIVPRVGRTAGVLMEAPVMVGVTIIAARWTTRRCAVAPTLGARASMGLVALGLLVVAEAAGTLWLRGLSLSDYFAGLVSDSGGIALMLFLVFAAMPTIIAWRSGCGARSSAPRRSQ
jgi:hypothetical protein